VSVASDRGGATLAIDETRRYELHEAARRTLGERPGDPLMEMLPPVGWADVATKHDLAELEGRLGLRLDARLHAEVNRSIRWAVGIAIAAVGAFGGALAGVAALSG
jgi:hypothetical protein